MNENEIEKCWEKVRRKEKWIMFFKAIRSFSLLIGGISLFLADWSNIEEEKVESYIHNIITSIKFLMIGVGSDAINDLIFKPEKELLIENIIKMSGSKKEKKKRFRKVFILSGNLLRSDDLVSYLDKLGVMFHLKINENQTRNLNNYCHPFLFVALLILNIV